MFLNIGRITMKKSRLISTIMAVGLMASLLVFAGCGGSKDDASSFVGTWNLSSMEQSGQTVGSDQMEQMNSMGLSCYIVLSEDKTAKLDMFGQVKEGTWAAKDASTCTITFDNQPADATLADGKLTLEEDSTKLVFEKGEATTDTSATPSASAATSVSPAASAAPSASASPSATATN